MADAQEQSKSALKKAEKQAKMAASKAEKAAKAAALPIVGGGAKKGGDSKEVIGITVSKEANFPQWYQELVTKAELVDYYHEVREPILDSSSVLRCWAETLAIAEDSIFSTDILTYLCPIDLRLLYPST